jgi:inner membrane protein
MALPIAHATAGYLVHRVSRGDGATRCRPGGDRPPTGAWRRAALFMLMGNLPDLDFLVGFVFGRPGMFHRGVSHTVLAAVAFGIAAGVYGQWRGYGRFGATALACGAAYLSHLVLDAVTIDHRPPFGAQFFWPLSSEYYISPVTIFSEIIIDGRTRADFLRTTLNGSAVLVLLREAVIAAATLGAWQLGEAWRDRSRDRGLSLGRRGEDLA